MRNSTDLSSQVDDRFPKMRPSETWEDYLERDGENLNQSDRAFLVDAINQWHDV